MTITFTMNIHQALLETIQMIKKVFSEDSSFKLVSEFVKGNPHSGEPLTSRTCKKVKCLWDAITGNAMTSSNAVNHYNI